MRVIFIILTIAALPVPALAQSEFSDSDQSSAGSNDSSASSNDSSANSNDSSDNSGQSSESNSDQSLDNSTRSSSEGTSDGSVESSQQPGMRVLSVVAAIVVVAGIGVGAGFWIWSSVRDDQEDGATARVEGYMRRNHGQLVREVALGAGPLLAALYDDLGLTPQEARAVGQRLEGSSEQTDLLIALDGEVDPRSAERFASAIMEVTSEGLGPKRMVELMRRHGVGVLAEHP